jgi:hypothetical protein
MAGIVHHQQHRATQYSILEQEEVTTTKWSTEPKQKFALARCSVEVLVARGAWLIGRGEHRTQATSLALARCLIACQPRSTVGKRTARKRCPQIEWWPRLESVTWSSQSAQFGGRRPAVHSAECVEEFRVNGSEMESMKRGLWRNPR